MMTWSPSFRPDSTSKYLVARDAGLDRHEDRLAVPHHEHALELLARLARPGARRPARCAGVAGAAALLVARLADDGCPCRRRSSRGRSSPGSAPHATLLARGGRDFGGAREARAHVRDLAVERDDDLEVGRLRRRGGRGAWIGLLPISVTLPVNVLSGIASIVIFASWPILTIGMSVSSTSTSASMTDMSAMVSSTVPALFIVPMTTVSPSSMLRRVTMPSIGDSMRTLLRS